MGLSVALHVALLLLPYLGVRHAPVPGQAQTALWARHIFTASISVAQPVTSETRPSPQPEHANVALHSSSAHATSAQPVPMQDKGLELLPIPAPSYYRTDQLTKRPQPVVLADLETTETHPFVASGNLILKLWIDERGHVVDAAAERSDLPEVFSRTAVDAFKRSRFLPGERSGMHVATVMRIEVAYQDGRVAAPR